MGLSFFSEKITAYLSPSLILLRLNILDFFKYESNLKISELLILCGESIDVIFSFFLTKPSKHLSVFILSRFILLLLITSFISISLEFNFFSNFSIDSICSDFSFKLLSSFCSVLIDVFFIF